MVSRWILAEKLLMGFGVVFVALFGGIAVGWGGDWIACWVHLGILIGFGCLLVLLAHVRRSQKLRAVVIVSMVFSLYVSLGWTVFSAIPWRADAWLVRADQLVMGGHDPVLLIQVWASPSMVTLLSFVYAFFMVYIQLSIVWNGVFSVDSQRDRFLTGFVLVYGVSYLGYILLPARGPIVFLADAFHGPLPMTPFLEMIQTSIDQAGGPHGAFPSLHVGGSAYMCLYDWHHHRVRSLFYGPVVVLVALSTLILRYHYLVDVLAGLVIAVGAVYLIHNLEFRDDT